MAVSVSVIMFRESEHRLRPVVPACCVEHRPRSLPPCCASSALFVALFADHHNKFNASRSSGEKREKQVSLKAFHELS